jgi:N-acetylneuraminic acid mutarotase
LTGYIIDSLPNEQSMSLIKRISFPVFVFVVIIAAISMFACNPNSSSNSTLVGNWIKKGSFDGVARSEAVSFTIGDTAYLGTGYDSKNWLNDFWRYDPTQNYWLQKASFPGLARSSAVGMSIGGFGYVGTGMDANGNYLKDFWQYDPIGNKWKAIADFGGSGRVEAVAFGIGTKGYVSTGYDQNYLKDLWQYDPATNAWTALPSLGGDKRQQAVAFVINGKAYICTGVNNGTPENDMWQFDPASGWTEKRKLTNVSDSSYDDLYTTIVRSNAVSFVIDSKAYITSGDSNTSTCWEYDPAADQWTQKTNFERSGRSGAVGMTVKNMGFVATGKSGNTPFDDVEMFRPADVYNAND